MSKVVVTFEVEPSRLMELVKGFNSFPPVGNPSPFGLRIAKVMATGEISLADMAALCAYGVELKDMKEVPNV